MEYSFLYEIDIENNKLLVTDSSNASIYFDIDSKVTVITNGFILFDDKTITSNVSSDAFNLFKCYQQHGISLVTTLSGQFFFLIYTHQSASLTLGQDCLGLHPVFYSTSNKTIKISNRLNRLYPFINKNEIDCNYIADYLEFGDPISKNTPYKEIKRLTFGETILIQNNKIKSVFPARDYFNDNIIDSKYSHQDMFRNLLYEATYIKHNINKNIWCEVSGGLDSTSVYCFTKLTNQNIRPLSIISESYKDDGDTEIVSELFGNNNAWIKIISEDFPPFSGIPSNSSTDEPGSEIYNSIQHKLNNLLTDEKVDVLMTGFGGDIVLGGEDCSPFYLADLLWTGKFKKLNKELKGYSNNSKEGRKFFFWFFQYAFRTIYFHALSKRVLSPNSNLSIPYWLTGKFIKDYNIGKRWNELNIPKLEQPSKSVYFQEILCACASEAASFSSFTKSFTYHPLLYKPLVKYMFNLPSELRFNAYDDRILQRKALKEIVPEIVLNRRNKGTFQYLFEDSYKSSLNWQLELSKNSFLVEIGVFEKQEWCKLLERAKFGLFSSLKHFIASISLEIWFRKNMGM